MNNQLQPWAEDKREVIRKSFAPDLNKTEFAMFVGLGKSLGANPFTREIWAVKYGSKEAQIFLGRDFYRRKAQEQPDYKGHQVDAVYSNDEFKMVNGVPEHSYNLSDRGEILGAYCVVYRDDNKPYFNFVEFSEYFSGGHKNKNLWDTKPATMIKKVAEAQALRGAYQGIFAGTYDESEEWRQEISVPEKREMTGDDFSNAIKAVKSGKQTVERLKELWDLTDEQWDTLDNAELEAQNA